MDDFNKEDITYTIFQKFEITFESYLVIGKFIRLLSIKIKNDRTSDLQRNLKIYCKDDNVLNKEDHHINTIIIRL